MPASNDREPLPHPSALATMTDRRFFLTLLDQGPMSRAAIAQHTGISKPTISEAAQRLLEQSLIVETDRRSEGRPGRSGVLYDIHAQRAHALGVALESGRLQARALNLKGETVWEHDAPLSADDSDSLGATVQGLIDASRAATGTELLSVGVSVADPVHPTSGEVIALPDSPFPAGHEIRHLEALSSRHSYTVTCDNDVNWATLAEKAFGCAQDADDFIYVYLGRGIGAGLYLSGRLYRGADGLAGEIGYLPVDGEGTLLRRLNAQPEQWDDDTLTAVGDAIATLTVVINPARVILGGPRSTNTQVAARLKQAVERRALRPLAVQTSAMPVSGPVVGASVGAHRSMLNALGMTETQ